VSEETAEKRSWRDVPRRLWMRLPARRRRWIVRGGVAATVLALILLIPGYVGSQPGFIGHYSNFHAQYQTWSRSAHAEVPCQRCHVSPDLFSRTTFNLKMIGEVYISPIARSRQPKVLSSPTNAACQSCHIDLRTVSPSGDLKIPHRAHVGVLGIKCVKCHAYLVHGKSPEGSNKPRMVTCLTCHDGRKAKNACVTCHTNKAAPAGHRSAEWLVIHPTQQAKLDCAKCHAWTAHWCKDCHSRRPPTHVAKWRTTHGLRVKAHRDCEACHQASFCVRCHGEVPKLNFDATVKLVQ